MTILGIHVHKWEVLTQLQEYPFQGEILIREASTGFRRCLECGKYQHREYNYAGSSWEDLSADEAEIIYKKYVLNKHIVVKPTPPTFIKPPKNAN